MKKIFVIFCTFFCYASIFSQTKILSLQECLDLALEQSNEFRIKQEEVKIAEYKRAQAKTAYLPKVNALLSYLHLSDKIYLLSEDKFLPIGTKMADGSFGFRVDQVNNQWTEINGNPVPLDVNGNPFDPKANPEKLEWKNYTTIPRDELAIDAGNIFVGALSLAQPIYMGGKIRQTNKMAEIGIDIAKEQEILQQSDVLYQTESAYWTVISVGNKVKTAEDYKNLLIALERNVTELFNEGMATKADILKVKVKLNEIDMNLTKAQNGLSLAEMQLCQYIGLPMNTDIRLSDEIAAESLKSASEQNVNLDTAWENRPEVNSLRKLIDLSETKEKIAFADYLPEVALVAGYMVTNPDFFNGFEKDFSGSWNIGVTMKIPILHWGEQKQKVREAKSEKHINELKLDDAKERIELQFRQAVYKIEETGKRLTAAENNFEQAKENLKYAELSYEEGLVTVTDVLDAQAAWYSAYSEKEDALIGLRIDNLYLKKVAGRLVAKK